jgi:PAS domain S-box-containing protein
LLALALLGVSWLVFDTDFARAAPAGLVYLPLPLLLWAAFRFGPAGAAASLASVALFAIWGAGHGTGAFASGSPLDNARSIQLLLVCMSPTLLCLAAAMRARDGVEEHLRSSDRRFQLVLEATRASVYEREVPGDTMWWSRGGVEQFGYAAAAARPEFGAWCGMIDPDDRERLALQQRDAMLGDQVLWEARYRLKRADGSHAHVHEQGFIVRDPRGVPTRLVAALTDVTQRHDSEELGQRLAHASRLTALGELAASIAHEINQPASAILLNVEAAQLLLDSGKLDAADLRAILAEIRSDDLRAMETVRHMRELANRRRITFEPFDANQLIHTVIHIAEHSARRRGARLLAECGEIPPVKGDRIHVQQVLLNLVFNAVEAMAGTPAAARRVTVRSRLDAAGQVEISVADAGHGVPEKDLERIFESFYTTKADGLGLGLAIARSIVHAHGGRIWAQNRARGGAAIHFTLPVAK